MSSVFPGLDTFLDPQPGDPGSNPSRAGTVQKIHAALRAMQSWLPQFGSPDGYLSAQINPGDRSFTLTRAPSSLFNTRDIVVLVDPGPHAEAREPKILGGATYIVNDGGPAFIETHAAGSPVYFIRDRVLRAWMFGSKADRGISDDWQPAQRCIVECANSGCGYGGGEMMFIRQPVYMGAIGGGGFNFRADEGFWITKQPGIQFMGKTARQSFLAAATASDNRITFTDGQTPGGLGLIVGKKIAFNQPYVSKTFPAGIQSGCLYRIESVGSNYVTIKHLQATGTVGAQVDITADGEVMGWSNMDSLTHLFLDGSRWNMYIADVGGFSCLVQQLSSLRNLFFESFSNCVSAARTIIQFDCAYTEGGGQEGFIENVSCTCGGNMVGIAVSGTGYIFAGNTPIVNATAGNPAIIMTGQAHSLQSFWMESCQDTGICFVGNADAIQIGNILNSGPASTSVWRDETQDGQGPAATIAKIRNVNNPAKIFEWTAFGGGAQYGWSGSGSHHDGITDYRNCAGPFVLTVQQGVFLAEGAQAPYYEWRTGSDGTTLASSAFYKRYLVDTTGGALAVNLQDQPALSNYEFAISRYNGGNSIVVTPHTGQIMKDDGTFTASVTISDNLPRKWKYSGQASAWVRT